MALPVRASCEHLFVSSRGPKYTEAEAREAVAASRSFAETLRRLGMCPTGGAGQILRKYVELWDISTAHFDPGAARREALARDPRPLDEILVEHSTFSRSHLNDRLYAAGLTDRKCELCGQGESWNGRRMSMILDHVNGVGNDNRLENLRIVCPNCAATLPTHCGRNKPLSRTCPHCTASFKPNYTRHQYCSSACAARANASPQPEKRKAVRPPLDILLREIDQFGYVAVGRRYGVTDNAIRKWLRAEGVDPPRGTWPNRRRDECR
jgi:hypothetical protein